MLAKDHRTVIDVGGLKHELNIDMLKLNIGMH